MPVHTKFIARVFIIQASEVVLMFILEINKIEGTPILKLAMVKRL